MSDLESAMETCLERRDDYHSYYIIILPCIVILAAITGAIITSNLNKAGANPISIVIVWLVMLAGVLFPTVYVAVMDRYVKKTLQRLDDIKSHSNNMECDHSYVLAVMERDDVYRRAWVQRGIKGVLATILLSAFLFVCLLMVRAIWLHIQTPRWGLFGVFTVLNLTLLGSLRYLWLFVKGIGREVNAQLDACEDAVLRFEPDASAGKGELSVSVDVSSSGGELSIAKQGGQLTDAKKKT